MKELDFDELDRAVSSLMSGVPKTDPIPQDDGVKTLTITPTLDANSSLPVVPSVPVMPAVAVAPTESSVVTNETHDSPANRDIQLTERSSLATRRSGRFMDVVHASSDMTRQAPTRPVSRQGVTLAPVATAPQASEATEPSDEIDVLSAASIDHAEPFEAASIAPATHDWPDPLDMIDRDQSEEVAALEEPPIEESTIDSDETHEAIEDTSVEESAVDNQPEPLVTPFLADAKVEKRPLGGVLEAPALVEPEVSAESQPTESQVVDTPAPEAAPVLPEEFQDRLVAIEAGVHLEESESAPVVVAPAIAAPIVATIAQQATPSGPVSIPQQYREEPTTGDQTNGSIYDTASYHQPLDHPAKKKSSWLWIVWVLGLLILGAAGGAAAYLYLLK